MELEKLALMTLVQPSERMLAKAERWFYTPVFKALRIEGCTFVKSQVRKGQFLDARKSDVFACRGDAKATSPSQEK
jgi:hypothetical protein